MITHQDLIDAGYQHAKLSGKHGYFWEKTLSDELNSSTSISVYGTKNSPSRYEASIIINDSDGVHRSFTFKCVLYQNESPETFTLVSLEQEIKQFFAAIQPLVKAIKVDNP